MERPIAFVVEDQMNLSILYEDALRLVGYDVKLFRNGLEAINGIELHDPPTFIVLDVNLPGLSGKDVLQHIRKNPKYAEVPILVATANSVMARVIAPELHEIDNLLIKPVSMMDLQKIAKDVAKKKLDVSTQELKSAVLSAYETQSMKSISEVLGDDDESDDKSEEEDATISDRDSSIKPDENQNSEEASQS